MMEFQWDERKSARNVTKHAIDFSDAIQIFDDLILDGPSRRSLSEERRIAIGRMGPYLITVVYTMRGSMRRIISARRASRAERKAYEAELHRLEAAAKDDGG